MQDARRLKGRLFYWAVIFAASFVMPAAAQSGPALTTIADTVYRADGTPAQGTLVITWPAFSTSGGQAVAAGENTVTLGTAGALNVQLAPNVGATPGNTLYTVVYQLDDGTNKTEFWMVGTTSPETLAQIRTQLGANTSTQQFATESYVNGALAAKANDNAVVHLSGAEVITGTKQFSVSPSLPTPVNTSDAANKAYVDNSVENAGAGNYVSKAGDTMTGPLTLPGAPSAPNQAATKQYVDTGISSKADLVSGVVPTGELASGAASSSVCLHGNSSWAACGTSSNAVSIQGTPVASTNPTNNQVLTYSSSTGQYAPAAGGGVSVGMQAVKYATDYAWTQTPSGNLGTPGAVTVNLSACPAGVTGTEPAYYIYVAGTGTAEAVLVTGGSCAGDGNPGTLQFTTGNAHASGYTVTSASQGLQEAVIAARYVPQNPPGTSQAGKVIVPPGEFNVYATVSIRSSDMTVDFGGSIVNCFATATCLFVGDASNSNLFQDITLISPRGRAMVANGQYPFIQDNAQKTRIYNVSTRVGVTNGTFSSYVQVDNDQSFLLDGLDTTLGQTTGNSGVLCNATTCNPVISAPGPFATYAAVGWLKNLNISMQCAGNGIDWQSGNTLRVSDSVIQGYSQYGVRAGTKRGGYGGFELENVYQEVGTCSNPSGAIGQAGVIAQGSTVKIEGGEAPAGQVPEFANTGSTNNHYFVVAHSTTYGVSNPLYAGYAMTSGVGTVNVTTPDIAGATTLDLLRVSEPSAGPEQAPYGTGSYAVASGVSRSSVCASGVCTFSDPQTTLSSYTVATPTYFPELDFWPASLVLGSNGDSSNITTVARAWLQTMPSLIAGEQGTVAPAAIATNCDSLGGWTPLWVASTSARLDVSQFAGSDAFAKINACLAALPSTGGSCDAGNLPATNSVSATLTISQSNVKVDFAASAFTAAAGTQILISGSNVEFNCLRGATSFNFAATAGTGTPGTISTNPDVSITGNNVRVRGCAVTGNRIGSGDTYSGSTCVRAVGVTGLVIEDNTVSQCGGDGIAVNNSDQFTIQRNTTIQTSGPGINVNSSSGGPYYGLKVVQGNQVYEAVTSVGLNGTYSAIPTGNYELNVVSSGGWGKTRNVRVLDNTIMNDFACTAGTGCDDLASADVCSGAGTAQATGCMGGMQVLATDDYEVAGNVVRNTLAEGIAVSGTGGNVHDNEESLIHVNTSGQVLDNGSGCVSFFISNANTASPTTQGDSKIHDNHCYDAGYVVQLILGLNTTVDGLTVENLDIHNNHGVAVTSTLKDGIRITNATVNNTPCGSGTRACNWTITNSNIANNDVSGANLPFDLGTTGLTDTTGGDLSWMRWRGHSQQWG